MINNKIKFFLLTLLLSFASLVKSRTEQEFLKEAKNKIQTTEDTLELDVPMREEKINTNEQLANAIIAHNKDLVSSLINSGADINNNEVGSTPLHLAVNENQIDIIKVLVEKGADVNAKDDEGYTPLDYATSNQNQEIIDYLEKNNAKLSEKLIKETE